MLISPSTLKFDPVFRANKIILLQICAALTIGLFFYAIVAVLFIIGIHTPPTPEHGSSPSSDPLFIPLICCSVFGGFAFIAAFFLVRSSRSVTVATDFLVVNTFLSRRKLRWTDIGSVNPAKRSVAGLPTYQVLEIQDRAGRTKLVITNTVVDFDTLTDVITMRISAVAGPEAIDQNRAKERRINTKNLLAFPTPTP